MVKAKGSPGQTEAFQATWDQVSALRLARHHLLERAAVKNLVSVVEEMTGAQAQLFSAAQLSLWTRLRDFEIAQLETAMRRRTLVKAACMRQTLFLVPSRELAVFVRGSARRAEKEIRWTLGKGVPERVLDAAIGATLDALNEPLTRQEIAERVCRALGVQMQAFHGGGWGSNRKLAAVPVGELNFPVVDLLHLVAARGVVCYGPNRENEPTLVRADAWIPKWKDMPREQAEDLLLHRYLRAFGPAIAPDFAMWTGITLREAREIWMRAQSRLAPVVVEGWNAEILRVDLEDLAQAKLEQPVVRLLPYFDTFLLGHRDRGHLVAAEHRSSVYRPQGWIAPVLLVNGRILGVWEHTLGKDHVTVKVMKFVPIARQVAAGIREEARQLGLFVGASRVEVDIS